MLKCPYCYEQLPEKTLRCPTCNLHIIDEVINVDFPSVDTKDCLFCGKIVLKEAKHCRHCHNWIDEVDRTIQDIDWDDFA